MTDNQQLTDACAALLQNSEYRMRASEGWYHYAGWLRYNMSYILGLTKDGQLFTNFSAIMREPAAVNAALAELKVPLHFLGDHVETPWGFRHVPRVAFVNIQQLMAPPV